MIVARGLGRNGVAAALLVTAGLGLVGMAESPAAGGGGLLATVRAHQARAAKHHGRAQDGPAAPPIAQPRADSLPGGAAVAEPAHAKAATSPALQRPLSAPASLAPSPAVPSAMADTATRGPGPLQQDALGAQVARAAAFEDDALALLIILAEATA